MNKKKKWIERGILALIFVVAVAVFSFLTNRGDDNTTAGIDGAVLPQISFEVNGYKVNRLSGYVKEMDVSSLRDTVTPVVNGNVSAVIDAYDSEVSDIEYIVTTLDGKEELYKNSISGPGEDVTLSFDDATLSEENLLKIILHTGDDKEIYYYTRIADATDANLKICLDYAKDFHEKALLKMEEKGIESAIETNGEGDNGTLQHVNIHSDFNHVTWGKLEPQVTEDVRWNIKELKNSYTCMELEYEAACIGEENEQDKYKVEEFFKIRHSEKAKKTYLLEYDREMDQIFEPIGQVLGKKGVLLGIADENISYVSNKDGTIVSFVQADELWSYNKEADELTLIFSFDAEEGYDERNLVRKHEIDILNHSNSGDIRFAVKGYMNRGNHEGEVGIAVYYYNAEDDSVKEEAFVSYDRALDSEVYFNYKLNNLYVLTEGTFHELKLDYRSQNVIAENLSDDEYKISDSGKIIAYVDTMENEDANTIILKNLKEEEEQKVTCEEGEILTPLGFIGTDFIYGISKSADKGTTISGQSVIPMYKIEIRNNKGETEMSYEKPGKYILSTAIQDNMITLLLVEKDGSVYTEVSEDYITNNKGEQERKVFLETYVTELKERQRRLTFEEELNGTEPKIVKANQTLSDKTILFALEKNHVTDTYNVYAYGDHYDSYALPGEAIRVAKQTTGVVVDSSQKCIWEMSNRDLHYTIPSDNQVIPVILENLKAGKSPVNAAAAVTGSECLDLTGCMAEDLLYIVNQNIPVIAMTSPKDAVVIVGYNEIDIFYKKPGDDTRHSVSYEKMDELTKKSGNTYIGVK